MLPPLAVFLVVALSFLWSAPRAVVLEDDGYFIVAAYFAAGAHPPGYPLFTLLAHMATQVPMETVAFRVHAMNAVLGALAAAAMWRFCRSLLLDNASALAAALAFGFSATFWSQSIIAEVYTLNVLLFFLVATRAIAWARDQRRRSRPGALAMGLLYGLALSNHWPLTLLSTPALLFLAFPGARELLARWSAVLCGLAVGLLPYAWLIYRTHVVPQFSFYGPINGWSDFWYVVSREAYVQMDFSPSAGWEDKLLYAGFVLRQTAEQFGPIGALFGLAGFFLQWRMWPWWVCCGLVMAYAGSTFVLIGLLGFDYDFLHRISFRVYPLISYGAVGVWLGLGMREVAGWAAMHARARIRPAVSGAALALLVAGITWLANAPANYRARDTWAEDYARVLLETLPADSVLYANADTIIGPVGYLHWVQGLRPDLTLQSGHSFLFDGRLYRPYLEEQGPKRLFNEYIGSSARPVFFSNDFPNDFARVDYGLYFQVDRAQAMKNRIAAAPRILAFFEQILHGPAPHDPWERMHYQLLLVDYCRIWAGFQGDRLPDALRHGIPAPCDHFQGRLLLLEVLLNGNFRNRSMLQSMLRGARELQDQAVLREEDLWIEALAQRLQEREYAR